MSRQMWISITDLGDSAVGLTLAALVLLALLASGWRRGAMAWLVAIAGCGAAMLLFKIGSRVTLQACGAVPTPVFSPSGHAALSTAVYGGLAVLSARQVPAPARILLGIASAFVVGLIAMSRVAIQAHTPTEVVCGLLVGLGSVALLFLLLRDRVAPRLMVPQLVAALALAVIWMYGTRWPVEETLHRLAAWIRQASAWCG